MNSLSCKQKQHRHHKIPPLDLTWAATILFVILQPLYFISIQFSHVGQGLPPKRICCVFPLSCTPHCRLSAAFALSVSFIIFSPFLVFTERASFLFQRERDNSSVCRDAIITLAPAALCLAVMGTRNMSKSDNDLRPSGRLVTQTWKWMETEYMLGFQLLPMLERYIFRRNYFSSYEVFVRRKDKFQ